VRERIREREREGGNVKGEGNERDFNHQEERKENERRSC
jgi:hypothetical protein